VIAFLILLALLGVPVSSTQGTVTKAMVTVDLVPGQPRVDVHVTNLSNKPIESWQVELDLLPES